MSTSAALKSTFLVAFDPQEIPIPSQVVALCGRAAELHPLILQSLLALAVRVKRIGVIVGDNRFDEYTLARFARGRGFDPAVLLRRIVFSRPFTCHQLHHCVMHLDASQTDGWRALYLLGLLETFWDEDIHYTEVARLLRDILERLNRFAEQGLPVLVTLSPPPTETDRAAFIAQVLDAADAYWTPSPRALEMPAINQMSMW